MLASLGEVELIMIEEPIAINGLEYAVLAAKGDTLFGDKYIEFHNCPYDTP